MNNDNDLNLHSMTKLSGWLRYRVLGQDFVVFPRTVLVQLLTKSFSFRLSINFLEH